MRRRSWYRGLALLAIATAGSMALLSIVALSLGEGLAAGAAGLCALVFLVPGGFFFGYARRLQLREVALAHAARLVESRGIVDAETLGRELQVPAPEAAKILRKSIQEGHAKGEMSEEGLFVAASIPRCRSCGAPLPQDPRREKCPSCGEGLAPEG